MKKFVGVLVAFAIWAVVFMVLAKFIVDTKVFKTVAIIICSATAVVMFISNIRLGFGRTLLLFLIYGALALAISFVPHFSLLSGAFILVPLFLFSASVIR